MPTLRCLQCNNRSTLSGSAVLRWFGIALEPTTRRPSFASAVSHNHRSDEIGAPHDHKLMSPLKQSANRDTAVVQLKLRKWSSQVWPLCLHLRCSVNPSLSTLLLRRPAAAGGTGCVCTGTRVAGVFLPALCSGRPGEAPAPLELTELAATGLSPDTNVFFQIELFSALKMQINHMLKVFLVAITNKKPNLFSWVAEAIAAPAGCPHLVQCPSFHCRASNRPIRNWAGTALPPLGLPHCTSHIHRPGLSGWGTFLSFRLHLSTPQLPPEALWVFGVSF